MNVVGCDFGDESCRWMVLGNSSNGREKDLYFPMVGFFSSAYLSCLLAILWKAEVAVSSFEEEIDAMVLSGGWLSLCLLVDTL